MFQWVLLCSKCQMFELLQFTSEFHTDFEFFLSNKGEKWAANYFGIYLLQFGSQIRTIWLHLGVKYVHSLWITSEISYVYGHFASFGSKISMLYGSMFGLCLKLLHLGENFIHFLDFPRFFSVREENWWGNQAWTKDPSQAKPVSQS